MSKTENATAWMERMAADNSHGYDQIFRWGQKGDYDCSAAVISAWQQAGVRVRDAGATYTGNMLAAFLKCGFADVTNSVTLSTGAGLKRGDVLLNTSHHTAIYCGNGREVGASINEKGTATGGKPGDQTGREFLVRAYRNYPWNHVLRYNEPDTKKSVGEIANEVLAGKWGNGSDRRSRLEAAGYDYSAVQSAVNAKLSGSSTRKTYDQLAREVIAGKWGTGSDRKKRLTAAGYDYNAVQSRVNELLR